jgi:hypothetical protein
MSGAEAPFSVHVPCQPCIYPLKFSWEEYRKLLTGAHFVLEWIPVEKYSRLVFAEEKRSKI